MKYTIYSLHVAIVLTLSGQLFSMNSEDNNPSQNQHQQNRLSSAHSSRMLELRQIVIDHNTTKPQQNANPPSALQSLLEIQAGMERLNAIHHTHSGILDRPSILRSALSETYGITISYADQSQQSHNLSVDESLALSDSDSE